MAWTQQVMLGLLFANGIFSSMLTIMSTAFLSCMHVCIISIFGFAYLPVITCSICSYPQVQKTIKCSI